MQWLHKKPSTESHIHPGPHLGSVIFTKAAFDRSDFAEKISLDVTISPPILELNTFEISLL